MYMVFLILTFVVNFILNFVFWFTIYALARPFYLPEWVPVYNREAMLTMFCTFPAASILIPAVILRYGPLQWLLVFSNGGVPARGEYKEILQRVLNHVCEKSGLHPEDFHLYTYRDEKDAYNALAIGTNRIIVSEQLLSDFSFEEVCGVVAHEIGHLREGHTKMFLWAYGMSWFQNIASIVYGIIYTAARILCFIPFLGIIVSIITFLFFLFLQILNFILYIPHFIVERFGSRKYEYAADAYASSIGLGIELACSLQHMDDIAGNIRLNFFERMIADHPDVPQRIERLGQLEAKRQGWDKEK